LVSAFKSAHEFVAPAVFRSFQRYSVGVIFLLMSQASFAQSSVGCAEQLQSSTQLYFSNPDSSNSLAIQAQHCAGESNQPVVKSQGSRVSMTLPLVEI